MQQEEEKKVTFTWQDGSQPIKVPLSEYLDSLKRKAVGVFTWPGEKTASPSVDAPQDSPKQTGD